MTNIKITFAVAKAIQPRNSQRSARDEAVAHMANRLYEFLLEFGPQRPTQTSTTLLPGFERVPPYLGEQLVPRGTLSPACCGRMSAEQDELPL